MKKKVYFVMDDALETKKKILGSIDPPHFLHGGVGLEKRGKAKIINADLKSILKIHRGSIAIVNRPNYNFLFRLKGIKVILIVYNSNRVLKMKNGLRNKLVTLYERIVTRLSNVVICLSNIQIRSLKEIGVKNIKVLKMGIDEKLMKNIKKTHKYYLTSGIDKGRNHGFVKNALKGFNLKVLEGKPRLPYSKYLEVLGGAKCLVLNVNDKKKVASSMSGTLTCTEALLMKKPIFINYQSWLKDVLKENYYVYKDKEDLIKLLGKNIKFRNQNYDYLTLDYFTKELIKIIESLK